MKTLEFINGQKVWAVDETLFCEGCMFRAQEGGCANSGDSDCIGALRTDNRDVIFQPYEEDKQEKTFTLSQINEVIDKMIVKSKGSYAMTFGYNSALEALKQKLEQL